MEVTSTIIEDAHRQGLPEELCALILRAQGSAFLNAVATASYDTRYTDTLLPLFRPYITDITQRWILITSSDTVADEINTLSCLAKIIPFAPHVRGFIHEFLAASRVGDVTTIHATEFLRDDTKSGRLLLAYFRLLSHDPEGYRDVIHPIALAAFLNHGSLYIRYLAVQCLGIHCGYADALLRKQLLRHVGDQSLPGPWEDTSIDYRLFKIHEEQRWQALARKLHDRKVGSTIRNIAQSDVCPRTAVVASTLLPTSQVDQTRSAKFVKTETSVRNLQKLAEGLTSERAILLVGSSGSGKSTLIREAAACLSKSSTLVTLHLNEQTDAKTLLGVYTTSRDGGAFVWQPGILTKAVQQGRWVLIEDVDRASAEVIGLLRPLLENNRLFLPSSKEYLRPANEFRVFATLKKAGVSSDTTRHSFLINPRLWRCINIIDYRPEEIRTILQARYPNITPFLATFLQAHASVYNIFTKDPAFRGVQSRLPSLRDLIKWCRRLSQRLEHHHTDTTTMPETMAIEMLKDAVDCYCAHLIDRSLRDQLIGVLAQHLQISPSAADHAVRRSDTSVGDDKQSLKVGRATMLKLVTPPSRQMRSTRFALTRQVRRTMEAIAAATVAREPLLLVGETGIGKTTIVQFLSTSLRQNLTVVNLSNQSEASDLLGSLKPVTTRSLIVPMLDTFNALFEDTFSSNNNEHFQASMTKALFKERWPQLIKHWREALRLASRSLEGFSDASDNSANGEQPTKRRKLDNTKFRALRQRWTAFATDLEQLNAQVHRVEQNQVFTFIESRLVQAVRNGEWLLLDEINLASAEALDNLLSLFTDDDDQPPYILLAEAGNIERIYAHPNFRIFAAMNPATDTGKKDLPPAIRAHFTELYIDAGDDDEHDLMIIIEKYLGSALESDKKASRDLARTYLALKQLSNEHKLTDGAGDLPHFSLRSLVRCLQYTRQHHSMHGLRRALYEGTQMSFFTVLSSASQQIAMAVVQTCLLTTSKVRKQVLDQQPRVQYDEKQYVAFRHYPILRGIQVPTTNERYIQTGSVKQNLMNLARAVSLGRVPILLQGPTSAGKTSMVEYLARLTGNRFVRINNHEHTDLQEYLGSYSSGNDGKLEFKEGVLVQALRQGHWLVLDELNLAPSDVLEALNRLLDDNRELLIPETQTVVRPHPNFMLLATQNPAGLYGGRKRLSRAFRNRFLEIHVDDIPEGELQEILERRTQLPATFCQNIVNVYKELSLQKQSSKLFESRNTFATLRDLFRWASRPSSTREELARHGYMLLAERVRDPTEKKIVKATLEAKLGVKLDEQDLYGPNALSSSAAELDSVVWTQAMRRLFVLVQAALQNNEPVLLVGETGCGKTQICQTIAQAFERPLNIYNAHANTETGDLIGAQRPSRQKAEFAQAVLEDLHALAQDGNTNFEKSMDIDGLINQFRKLDTTVLDASLVKKASQSIAAYQSLFRWNDGILVRAMKAGEHFLLDEISLADDSVLERLNSLLEPARTILLAEKGADDNLVVAHPLFQFLATMNPGGDYGKRELSAALRNRLTEIWVPPLSDKEDILPIVRQRLTSDDDCANWMLEFAHFFRLHLEGGLMADIKLRLLLNWADFMNRNRHLDLQEAFIHGAAMVFIDSLGAQPAGLMHDNFRDASKARQVCLDYLSNLLGTDAGAAYYAQVSLVLEPQCLQIGPFAIPRSSESVSESDLVLDIPTTVQNAMRVIRALQVNRPILLEGNPGVGKTAVVSALAKLCGQRLTRVNLSDQTDLMDLFGADAPSDDHKVGLFTWRNGPLLEAMQAGEWVLLDEMNLATQSVLEGLNACLDHRQEVYVAELDKTFRCHPGFTLFATQNPHTQGGGRKGLPASFVNRFTVVYADPFKKVDLELICQSKYYNIPVDQVSKIVSVVDELQILSTQRPEFSDGGPWELNLRDLGRWMTLCQRTPQLNPASQFPMVVAARFRNAKGRGEASRMCEKYLGLTDEQNLFQTISPEGYQLGFVTMLRQTAWSHVHDFQPLRVDCLLYAQSIMAAISQNWPIVLAGSSSSGKTSLVRSLAGIAGASLTEVAMSPDIDIADLIGGFEQYDEQREIQGLQRRARHVVEHILAHASVQEDLTTYEHLLTVFRIFEDRGVSLETLARTIGGLAATDLRFKDIATSVEHTLLTRSASEARFVWNDGILIDAISSGSWLVLDNANLCSASVLDRLNGLLEPEGHLVVSEQHSTNGRPRVVYPHPDFRIILIMDPKYGELSRAMRNRSLEIFMDVAPLDAPEYILPWYPTDSSIARIRNLILHDDAVQTVDTLEPYMAELSMKSLETLNDPKTLHSGILTGPQREEVSLRVTKQYLAQTSPVTQENIQQYWYQPHLLILNEPLLRLTASQDLVDRLQQRASQAHLALVLCRLQNTLNVVSVSGRTTASGYFSLLQKTAPSVQKRSSRHEEVEHRAFELVSSLIDLAWIVCDRCHAKSSEGAMYYFKDLTMFSHDLAQFFDQGIHDRGKLQAYLSTMVQLLSSMPEELRNNDAVAKLKVLRKLTEKSVQSRGGQSLQKLWAIFKELAFSSAAQLQAQRDLERLLERFTEICQVLPQPRATLAKLQLQLVRALSKPVDVQADHGLLAALTESVLRLEQQKRPATRTTSNPHFEGFFEILVRRRTFDGFDENDEKTQLYTLLAHSPVSLWRGSSEEILAKVLRRLAAWTDGKLKPTTDLNSLPGQISAKRILELLKTVPSQTLGSLDYTREELSYLTQAFCATPQTICSDPLQSIRELCSTLMENMVQSLYEGTSRKSTLMEVLHSLDQLTEQGALPLKFAENESDHFVKLCHAYFKPATFALRSGDPAGPGRALILASLAGLQILVPEKASDPSIHPMLMRERHDKRTAEYSARILSWKTYQLKATGQTTSLVIRSLEEQKSRLGEPPDMPVIYRPDDTALNDLQVEYTNLLRSIIHADTIEAVLTSSESVERFVQPLIAKIKTSIERLSHIDRAYDDLTRPVIGLLHSLWLGLWIYACTTQQSVNGQDDLVPRAPSVGLLYNLSLQDSVLSQRFRGHHNQMLRQLGLVKAVGGISADHERGLTCDAIAKVNSLYLEWKKQLTQDQKTAEAQSKYYTYRGEDTSGESDERYIMEMFPTYDDAEADGERQEYPRAKANAREVTLETARLHRSLIFVDDACHALNQYIVRSGEEQYDMATAMPALLLEMDHELEMIASKSTHENLNVYTDTDISEARKLFDITLLTQARFEQIHEAWPDHAVPTEALAYCLQVLKLTISEPVMKLLAKTEKFLEVVTQWQAVASKEWSVANIVDSLTHLIIHWRRLELRSWSRLLDEEIEKQKENTDSWYFVAFEAVIHNSVSVIEQTGDISDYCKELSEIVEEFFRSASLGEFSHRLQLLNVLTQTLGAMAYREHKLKQVYACVQNVVAHYARFAEHTDTILREHRSALEGDIQEQIKLASWKDTNPTALRESAKRSHRKLFNIIKKFRTQLAQPTSIFRVGEAHAYGTLNIPTPRSVVQTHVQESIVILGSALADWGSRSVRLRDPISALSTIQHVYSTAMPSLSRSDELSQYLQETRSRADELRKATPSISTDENGATIRDLKQGKRRLLADVMKDLIRMGVRRNLGTEELRAQSSVSSILARLPCGDDTDLPFQGASMAFHELLDYIPAVRQAVIEHSEELTDGEIRRGLGLLEGILSITIRQHTELARASAMISQLDRVSTDMLHLQEHKSALVQADSQHRNVKAQIIRQLAWLTTTLKVFAKIADLQAKHGSLQIDNIIQSMQQYSRDLEEFRRDLTHLPSLPVGLISDAEDNLLREARSMVSRFHDDLGAWLQQEPQIEYLILQLQQFVLSDNPMSIATRDSCSLTIARLDQESQDLQNSVFVTLQQMTEHLKHVPDVEDQAWFTETERHYRQALEAMHMDLIAQKLQAVLDKISSVGTEDLPVALSIMVVSSPILQQYGLICRDLYHQQLQSHHATCRLATYLCKTFTTLAREGFCTPPEKSSAEDQPGKVEQGTGLGDGEGAEDISKDVGDDEDLTELAQSNTEEQERGDEAEKSKDAVDMGTDDLEGDMGSGDEQVSGSEDNENQSDGKDQEIDEETGSVDDLDPSAVDEKMWDEMQEESKKQEKDMKSQKAQGQKSDEQAAGDDGQEQEDEMEGFDDASQGNQDDTDSKQQAEGENVDPHLQQEEALDLPEDMQLNGDEKEGSDLSDADMDDLSDVEQDAPATEDTGADELDEADERQVKDGPNDDDSLADEENANEDGINEDTANEQPDDEGEDGDKEHGIRQDKEDIAGEQDQQAGESGVNGAADIDQAIRTDENASQGKNENDTAVVQSQAQEGQQSGNQESGSGARDAVEQGVGQDDQQRTKQDEALNKLADVLEQYHRRREILTANEERQEGQLEQDVDMDEADFEHLGDDDKQSDAQALGSAQNEVKQNIDPSKAIEDTQANAEEDLPMPGEAERQVEAPQESLAEKFTRIQEELKEDFEQQNRGAIVPDNTQLHRRLNEHLDASAIKQEEEQNPDENQLSLDRIDRQIVANRDSQSKRLADAEVLWSLASTKTQALSLSLTEQLRLILQPTTATKLRGDFRTGKRLNIRRIIPYIASGYKRDKIWMRRSIPSKRNYQIMLAVDDSKSMAENGADILALETLCMLTRSLSMLEAGELCVLAFGQDYQATNEFEGTNGSSNKINNGTDNTRPTSSIQPVKVAHSFTQPFSPATSGPSLFSAFTFSQLGTNIYALLTHALNLLTNARHSSSNSDLWQLLLVISDGHVGSDSNDHIKRLVRRLREEKVIVVFVIVDAAEESIVDMSEVIFEAGTENRDGTRTEGKVVKRRYLEFFPFEYYVVVREVADLPGVLSRVLKGWFEGVVSQN